MVWRFVDGRPGHENQSLGLAEALAGLLPLDVHRITVHRGAGRLLAALLGRCTAPASLPAPDLLIGAGHATHAPMLGCRRRRGGRVVVLMRPTLPRRWFDLCVVPEHDRVASAANVWQSRGVLNAVRPGGTKDPDRGLILVGGPSRHYRWDEQALCEQVRTITARDRRHWTLASSRRTPPGTLQALGRLAGDRLELVPSEQTAPGWLAGRLERAAAAWVTEDSVSMLYEALTAGAACGVLPVPLRRAGRVRAGLERLLADHLVVRYADWARTGELPGPARPLDEAGRCARWIRDRWFAR